MQKTYIQYEWKRMETDGDKENMQKRIETRRSIRKRVETDMNCLKRYQKKQKVFNGQKYRESSRQKQINQGRNEEETSWKNI